MMKNKNASSCTPLAHNQSISNTTLTDTINSIPIIRDFIKYTTYIGLFFLAYATMNGLIKAFCLLCIQLSHCI